MNTSLQVIKRAVAILLFIGAAIVLVQLIGDLNRVKLLKSDRAELQHVRYGLLDADQWVARISTVIEKRVGEFELTEDNRAQVVEVVEQVLDSMLVEIERTLRQRNLNSGGTWVDQLQGALQQSVQDLLIDFEALRKKVPRYAETVVEQLSQPATKQEISARLIALVRQASTANFAKVDRTALDAVLARHACADTTTCARLLTDEIDAKQGPLNTRLGLLAGLLVLLLWLCLSAPVAGRPAKSDGASVDAFKLLLLMGASLLLLLGGILTPMLEIDARIGTLTLVLLDEPIIFTDQVLYFQTKSIIDVARILAETGAVDMLLVALLLMLFSVIFPAIKLIATYVYAVDFRQARASSWVRFFALRSGKWSMADVLVVAMFMAYIGFDGLVSSQLRGLARVDDAASTQVLTTNGTALEPGFYLFLAFVLVSLLLSTVLERQCAETHQT